ncbi:g13367 [Coccomyxa viridis]|uniref:HVA22-like protein n=1 Tax=Coccomyxa viridis TaxID=1274662 RepID=A0ABP1GCK6_9CHLO
MLGDFSCRVILNIVGFVWPAYQNYKTISQKQTDATQQWCMYWLMLALFTVSERMVLDMLVFWVPMYYEAKVLFVLYLWHPKTQGAVYLYNTLLQPFLSQNEAAIDQCIEELKTAFFDYTASYFQKLVNFVQANAHHAIVGLQQLQAKGHFHGQRKSTMAVQHPSKQS